MALGSTQPLVKMSTRNIPGGKGGRCVRRTNSPHSCAECHGIWESTPSGNLWATPGLFRDTFNVFIFHKNVQILICVKFMFFYFLNFCAQKYAQFTAVPRHFRFIYRSPTDDKSLKPQSCVCRGFLRPSTK